MSGIDIFIVICSLGFFIWGLVKGLTRMVMTIIAIFVGVIFATRSYDIIGGWMMSFIGNRSAAMMIGFIIAFLVILVTFTLLAKLIKKTLDAVNLGCLDHLLGGGLGFVSGVLLSSVVIITLALFSPQRANILNRSFLAPYVIEFSSVIVSLVPDDLREEFFRKYYDLKRHEEKEASAPVEKLRMSPSDHILSAAVFVSP